ncbi:MAG TPA: hypothetical protein VJN02_03545, partial [Gammaproteobacteria bacterium]|nr:hypothetical protein [Gammaproteobacteria bacterium]
EKSNQYLFQCINTKATFLATITDLILDGDILYSLHPIQACYIGIEYATQIKNNQQSIVFSDKNMSLYSFCRYGTLRLLYQDRKRNLCFIDLKTQREFIMDPREIALSEQFISEFDSVQAFYIGFSAGLKMNHQATVYKDSYKNNPPKLILIKS